MRLIHTADWHLGHTLAGHSREAEHARFLDFLLDTLGARGASALVVSGDVYDQGHPPASAQRQFFSFIAEARRRMPTLNIVVIGGNHDTAARLDAAGPILSALDVTVLGGLPRDAVGLDLRRTVIPLRAATGSGADVEAVAIAVPFLRAPELSLLASGDDVVRAGTRAVVERAAALARTAYPGVPVIALAHCELAGARLSLSSERPLFGGRHALPADLFFQAGVDYAALGHLHLAQQLGPDGRARYSGSPIPLSMTERHYVHQVVDVDFASGGAGGAGGGVVFTPIVVPRAVDFIRVPDEGNTKDLDEVLDRLRAIDLHDRPVDERPFLDVRVRLDKPVPDLRARIEMALEGKPVRLVRIERETDGDGAGLSDVVAATETATGLVELSPAAVFSALYQRQFGGTPPAPLMSALSQLVDDDARAHARQNHGAD
jgi:exonuclease SbcD